MKSWINWIATRWEEYEIKERDESLENVGYTGKLYKKATPNCNSLLFIYQGKLIGPWKTKSFG